jgi:hypothetical protein
MKGAEQVRNAEWLQRLENGKFAAADQTRSGRGPADFLPDIVYAMRNGRPLLLDLAKPKEKTRGQLPVIVYIHGGGWSAGSRKSVPDALWLMPGFIKISMDYRLTGAAPFPEPGCLYAEQTGGPPYDGLFRQFIACFVGLQLAGKSKYLETGQPIFPDSSN